MLFSLKNSILTKIFLVLLLSACSSLKVEQDEFNSRLRVYQYLNKNSELKGVVDYKNNITRIFLYTKFRNHSIVQQTPLILSDGSKIEGKTSYEYDHNALFGNWINYSSFSVSRLTLEKMLREEEHIYNKEHIKMKIGLEELQINKAKIIDFLSMVDATEKQHTHKYNKKI
ncbi:oligopeptide permease-like protein (plasmid) [Candidatus Borreliella tachyglossi]|uniref:Oligopeptide permease-like protein n=1 Tax=Candidatus Borreliella tachyglossi TaxID=1964448 RepID=A0A2S1LYJ9_9SPIR|nr:oligopeptide permease-like protein [Candidatus Borreliella tachyglossi]AWG43384.1 oligopeptide permease-like protein [Candidatus Borreliella tachyglossi]